MRTAYETAVNGQGVGSGYDATAVAHDGRLYVYLDAVGRADAWLMIVDDEGEDLGDIAYRVGSQGPGWFGGCEVGRDSDEWESTYARFEAAKEAAASSPTE